MAVGSAHKPKLPRLRWKGNAAYFDTQAKPRQWIALGSHWPTAHRRYLELIEQPARVGTVDAALASHLSAIAERVTAGTRSQYRAWRMHLSAVFGHLPLSSVTPADILRYLDDCPRTSARGEVALLSGAYRWAMRHGMADSNPCVGMRSDKPRAKRTRYLSDAEVARIRAASPPLLQTAIDLDYLTGLRASELIALRWADFGADHVQRVKDGLRSRYLLTDDLAAVLAAARALQPDLGLYVLMHHGKPLNQYTLGEWWRKSVATSGVSDARWHDLRAKAATDADAQGQDATALLGHRNPQTTRTYLRGREIRQIEPVRRVEVLHKAKK